MPTKRIVSGWYQLAGHYGHEIHLEFDGLSGLQRGLEDFLRQWAIAPIRPAGTCFTVWVEGRDFVTPVYAGPSTPTVPVCFGSYLLLRVDNEHPYFGDRRLGWVLVQPNPDPTLPAQVVAATHDGAEDLTGSTVADEPASMASIVGP
jgi:hypothetical protein